MLTFHILNVYVDKTQPRQFKFTFNKKKVQNKECMRNGCTGSWSCDMLLTFDLIMLTFDLIMLTFDLIMVTFDLIMLTFDLIMLTFDLIMLTFDLIMLTFDLIMLTFDLIMLTFDLIMLTFDLIMLFIKRVFTMRAAGVISQTTLTANLRHHIHVVIV